MTTIGSLLRGMQDELPGIKRMATLVFIAAAVAASVLIFGRLGIAKGADGLAALIAPALGPVAFHRFRFQ